jgi:hypothetical protein
MKILLLCAVVASGCASVPIRAGHTYEVIWAYQQGGYSAEVLTIVQKTRTHAQDAKGYIFPLREMKAWREVDRSAAPRPPSREPLAPIQAEF